MCRKHRGEIPEPGGAIVDDGLVRAGHMLPGPDDTPAYLGHLFVEPRRHAAGLRDLTDEKARALGLLVTRLSRALMHAQGAAHVYAFVFGDNVPPPARPPGAPLPRRDGAVSGHRGHRLARRTARRRRRNPGARGSPQGRPRPEHEVASAIILSAVRKKPVTLPVDRGEYDALLEELRQRAL